MLKIKLARFGKKNQPHFRIIVNEARSKRDGQYIALLGHYAPTANPKLLELDLKAYQDWISKGAQPTETVANLAKRVESGNPFPEKPKKLSKKAKAKASGKTEKVKPVVETPAEAPVKTEAVPEIETEVTPEVVEETTQEPKTNTPTE
jgi:small subunit ribosomal protein S16